MTQIVSELSRGLVLQVEDRLLTAVKPGFVPEKFDPLANKNIIYEARDAIVSMGYTGRAYINNTPTDDWIASTLTGIDVSEKFSMRTGKLPNWWYIGEAISLLHERLKNTEIAVNKEYFELDIVGWKWKKGRRPPVGRRQPVPFGCSIRKECGNEFEVVRPARHWYWKSRTQFKTSPDGGLSMTAEELTQLMKRIGTLPANQHEQAIVDAIRAVAVRNPYVGPNCMSILIPPPQIRALVQATFFPHEKHTARVIGSHFVSPDYNAAYSPWIIGNGLVQKPSVFIGDGWHFQIGLFTVLLNGFPAGPGAVGGFSSVQRPSLNSNIHVRKERNDAADSANGCGKQKPA